MEWTTLVSTVVGAGIATASAAVLERQRGRRERADRGADVRRELYGSYLASLSHARHACGVIVRSDKLEGAGRLAAAREAFEPCIALRYQVAVVAPAVVVLASERAFRSLRDLRDVAAGGGRADGESYLAGRDRYADDLIALRESMRGDMRGGSSV
ncbi:hypothetical protein [Streptomyces sp. NPDC054866]